MGDLQGQVRGTQNDEDGQCGTLGAAADQSVLQEESYRRDQDEYWKVERELFGKAWEGKIKVLICEPTIGDINYQAHESMCDLIAALKEYERVSPYKFFKTCLGRLLVSYAREKFAEYAVNVGFDYIMFLDDDHLWPLNIFNGLEKHIKDYDIVSPLCLQRQYPYTPVIYKSKLTPMADGRTLVDNAKYAELIGVKKGDIITDADAIGFGAAIIKVDLLKKVSRPWFFNQVGVGEDIWFCIKAKREANAKILVDTNIEAPHLGDRDPIYWEDYVKAAWETKVGQTGQQEYKKLDDETKKNIEEKHGKKSVVGNAVPDTGTEKSGVSDVKSQYCAPI